LAKPANQKTGSHLQVALIISASVHVPDRCALFCALQNYGFQQWNFAHFPRLSVHIGGLVMLVERGLRVMNVEAVGDAYAIASNYLRKTGAIPDSFMTNDRLLEIIVQMFHRGEFNKIRLANKAISQFEATQRVPGF
jgi:hypothetical protein